MLSIHYKGIDVNAGYRLDVLIPDQLFVELKGVGKLSPIHTVQLLTYLKLTGMKRELIINFNVTRLVGGIKRVSL